VFGVKAGALGNTVLRRSICFRIATLALAGLPLAGCAFFSARAQVRGNKVDPEALAELVPGVSTRTDATSLLGTPTAHASFDDNTWLYIGSITRPVIGGTQHINVQEVVSLTFDQGGVLRDVETLGKKQSLPVTVVARVTPSPGSSASFMQQLLGNVGRFSGGNPNQSNTVGTAANGSGDTGSDSSRFGTGQ
jgi:outer membrane protein assembly factor BamE (lipoprotein component of BamABCDE complex)